MAQPERFPNPDSSGEHAATGPGGGIRGPALSRRSVLKAGLFAGTSAALVACTPAQESAAPPESAAPGDTATPATAAPSEAAARGGTIRMGAFEGGLTDGFLPWKSFGQEFAWNWCAQSLVSIAADGSILYDLATGFDVSPDGTTYTFHLVEGATWHDGQPVTAADVAFTYNTGLKTKAGSNIGGRLAPIKGSEAVIADESLDCEGIRVVDDLTIAFDLTEPNAQVVPNVFAIIRIAPKHPFDGKTLEEYTTLPISQELFIGSGPYKMTEFKAKEFVNFEPHPGYKNGTGYSGAPAADAVSIRIYADDAAQILSTQSGEVDFNYVRRPSGDKLKTLQEIAGMTAQQSLVGFNIFFSVNLLNPSTPLLKDKNVRKALTWALDRDLLVGEVLGGVFKVPDVVNHWIQKWAVADDLETYHPQNVDLAKELLATAGWDPNTVLDVRHYPPTLDPDIPVIQAMWEDIGVKIKLTPLPDDTFVADFYEDKDKSTPEDDGPNYDIAFVYGFGTLDGSPWGSDETLGSTRVYPNGFNSMRFANAEWDSEFAAALKETTQDAQAEHFKRCSQIFNDELPYMPIYQRVDYAVVSNKLKGPEKAAITHPAAGGIHFWEWYVES
jgi:peptide/nickel transport system substrate-binding protein